MVPHLLVSVPFSMRMTTTTLYEHTNQLLVDLVVESNEGMIDRNGRIESTLLLMLQQQLPFRRIVLSSQNAWSMCLTSFLVI